MKLEHKVKDVSEAILNVEHWKKENKKIVFTNGCFDILHYGHLQYLQEAKSKGDILIVGANTDSSIRHLKGDSRPIQDQKTRLSMLASLMYVDLVIPFSDYTPINIIKSVLPDVLLKGGDYEIATIVGAKEVIDNGGDVVVIDFVDGYSTSQIIEKIRNL